MDKVTVSFRTEAARVKQLDALAKAGKRDRTQLISEAIDNYIEAQEWQLSEIQSALRDAEARDFATDAEVEAIFGLQAK
jgi:predicted transcriptional regulator